MSGQGARRPDDAIFADEIGIEYAVLGEYRLRSAYQPIFAACDGFLTPVAVEALIEPSLSGMPVPPKSFFEALASEDRLYGETLCRILHLRNFRNIGVPELELFFNYNPKINGGARRALAEIRLMAMHLGEIDVDPRKLVCEITEQAAPDDKVLARLVGEMRRNGIRIAVDDFGAGHSTAERMNLVEPDIVKLDGVWFGQLCRHAAAERLFRPLVDALKRRGTKVLVEGIESAEHLRVALEGGVDLLQGFYLARPKLAGTVFEENALPIAPLLHSGARVLPFQPIHQRR